MGEEPNSYDCKKASINHSVLSAVGGEGDVLLCYSSAPTSFRLQQ
jgi:hypothetical protein